MGALCLYGISYSQTGTTNDYSGRVGINTNQPQEKLHIKGNLKTKGSKIDDAFTKLGAAEEYSFLIKSPAPANRITSYNQTFLPQSPAPLNLIQFKITCHSDDKDWVKQYDTKISASKYSAIIASYGFNLGVSNSNGLSNYMTPTPQIYAFVPTGKSTWHLKADYESFRPTSSSYTSGGVWTLNLIVFDKSYAKESTEVFDMNGATTYTPTKILLN